MNEDLDERLGQSVDRLNQGRLQEGKDSLEVLDAEYPEPYSALFARESISVKLPANDEVAMNRRGKKGTDLFSHLSQPSRPSRFYPSFNDLLDFVHKIRSFATLRTGR